MRPNVIVGLSVSALIHAGLLFGGALFPHPPVVRKPVDAITILPPFEMPRFEPEKPDVTDTTERQDRPVEVAAPTIPDVPQPTTDISFIQPVQLTPPDTKPTPGLLTVPDGRRSGPVTAMRVWDPSLLDQQPVARVRTPPQYPFEMKRLGISGEVTVDFIVDSNGDVQNATALKSTHREFEAAAVQAVGKWKFKAGRKAGHAVNTHMQVPLVFTLTE